MASAFNVSLHASALDEIRKGDGKMQFDEYKVIHVAEGGCGTILLGSSGIPTKKLEKVLND